MEKRASIAPSDAPNQKIKALEEQLDQFGNRVTL